MVLLTVDASFAIVSHCWGRFAKAGHKMIGNRLAKLAVTYMA